MRTDPLIPALRTVPGHYDYQVTGGPTVPGVSWSYTYDIGAPATRTEHRTGTLTLDGIPPVGARRGDRLETPWGVMQLMDGPGEKGWLLDGAYGRRLDPCQGALLSTPSGALSGDGRWRASVGRFRWELVVTGSGYRRERISGRLSHGDREVAASSLDDRVETPWGRLAFRYRVDADPGPRHTGWLPVAPGDAAGRLLPVDGAPVAPAVRIFRSPYLRTSALEGHAVALTVDTSPGAGEWEGVLLVDPNVCTLGAFGDGDACTHLSARRHDVRVSRSRIEDPSHLGRRLFQVTGDGLPRPISLITDPAASCAYLKLDDEIVPLHPDPR